MSINNLSFGHRGFGQFPDSFRVTRSEQGQRLREALLQYRQKMSAAQQTTQPVESQSKSTRALLVGAASSGGVDYDAIARALLARLDALWQARGQQWGGMDAVKQYQGCCCHHEHSESPTITKSAPTAGDVAVNGITSDSPTATASPMAPAASPSGSTGGGPTNPTPAGDLPFDSVRGFVLNDDNNIHIANVQFSGTENGVLVDNGQWSENVTIDGLVAHNTTRYGMYLGAVRNWTITNTSLQQAAGANEHGLRIADGEHISISNTTIDTTQAGKSALWFLNVDDAIVQNSTISGGAIRFGAPPHANLGAPQATNIIIRDSVINKVGGGDREAFQLYPGSNHIHLANLDITLTTAEDWLSIDSRNTANITWENIRVNGELVTGFEGVRLGGMTEEEALARGIGPAGAVA